jgi:hypothetical protein
LTHLIPFRQIARHTYEFDIKEQQLKFLNKMLDKSDEGSFKDFKQKVADHFLNIFFKSTADQSSNNGPRIVRNPI